MALPPLDIEKLRTEGGLEAAIRGRADLARREGRMDDIITEITEPLCSVANRWMQAAGTVADADSILKDAYHAGVTPTQIAFGMQRVWFAPSARPEGPLTPVPNPEVPKHGSRGGR